MANPNDPISAALAFVKAINRHDVGGLVARMTADHVFVDSLGHRVEGREAMKKGWEGYFHLFPDYRLEISEKHFTDDRAVLLGVARGTYGGDGKLSPENRWEIPVALRAVVRGGLVAEWRVYADNSPVLRILSRMEGGSG